MILFFDIDGTLMDGENKIPESTVRALEIAGKNGHQRFLCTGRTCSMLPEVVLALGFDGMVAGAGTYIQIGEEILEDRELTPEEVRLSLSWLSQKHFGFLYEGRDCVHVMPWDYYEEAERYQKHIEYIGAPYEVIDVNHPEQIHTAKFSGTIPPHQWEYCQQMGEALKPYFHMIIHKVPNICGKNEDERKGQVEFLPNGFHKAGGIKQVLSALKIPLSQAYAFGDSNNDLEMLKLVPHSVCMGNGTQEAKKMAEYITSGIREDGIYRAMEYYGLL